MSSLNRIFAKVLEFLSTMLFQKTIVNKYKQALPKETTENPWQQYQQYFLNKDIQQNILQSKEEQFQEGFLRELFVKVLGYTLNPLPNYNLITEKKNETNSKKADGAIQIDGKVIGVIELKDHKTPDLSKVEPQAFNYKSQHVGTRLVIISNFEKLRLYIDNAVEYREWNLFTLTEDDFRELYLCLAWPQVVKGVALQMKGESVSSEDQITQALYKDYSQFKRNLFDDILKQNPTPEGKDEKEWQLLLFKKTQKLLDRLLFIFFAEDCGLLPPNSMVQIIDQWEKLKEMDEYRPFYDRVKKYFGYMNTGYQGKKYEIFAYNGGLFKPDEVLDNIKISDDLLVKHTRKLSEYDFESDVDVNILGHIFENSLSEIEEVSQQITSGNSPTTSKRKQDGVFYTPQYITKYIVENTVGRLCAEKKLQFNIKEEEYFSDQHRQLHTKKRLLDQLQQYRDWLLQITILDPACGSGAFLNAALQFLMKEHKLIDEMEAKITGSTIEFQSVENSILENNLYGVDINEESVEIAQLALWLRTAKPHRKLNSLNENIKCGNSLISDPAIAGDKAFNWQEQFPKVFEKGGFDVVIGNPPYGAQLSKKEQIHLENDYQLRSTDTACLFMGLALRLVKENSPISYIIPKPFLYASNWKKIRSVMLPQINSIVDCSKVWPEVKLEQVIFNATKGGNIEYYNSLKRNKTEFQLTAKINKVLCERFDFYLNGVTIEEIQIAEKMLNHGVPLNNLAVNQRGAMCQNSILDTKSDYKVFGGKQIGRYITKGIRGFVSKDYVNENKGRIVRNSVLAQNIIAFIDNPYPHIKIIATIVKDDDDIIILDTVNQLSINIGNDNRYILSIINSKLISWYVYRFIFGLAIRTMHFDNAVTGRIPIPEIAKQSQQPFITLADTILSLNKELQEKRNKFLRRLLENMEDVKITSALQAFDQLDFKAFVAELKKQKIKLSLSQQDEWEDYFNQYREACNQITAQIAQTDNEIDQRVFDLYGLTQEEREIVMNS